MTHTTVCRKIRQKIKRYWFCLFPTEDQNNSIIIFLICRWNKSFWTGAISNDSRKNAELSKTAGKIIVRCSQYDLFTNTLENVATNRWSAILTSGILNTGPSLFLNFYYMCTKEPFQIIRCFWRHLSTDLFSLLKQ